MAEEMVKAQAAEAAGGLPKTQETGAQTQAEVAEKPEERVITLTERELRSRLDREVQKALQTRTANLEKEKQELLAEIERLRKQLEETGLSVEEKVKLREKEVSELRSQAKSLRAAYESVMRELESLVEARVGALSEDDRMLVDAMFTEDMGPLAKLRILDALERAGKISFGGRKPERGVGFGTVMRPSGAAGGEAQGGEKSRLQRLVELGRSFARGRGHAQEEGYVPPEWQGR